MAVGMAMAERHLNAEFGDDLVDHRTWVIAGDGCLMEGINHEAIGLAGHLKLGRLNVLWDDNRITIDGDTDLSTSEDIPARYPRPAGTPKACDGHDFADIARALGRSRGRSPPVAGRLPHGDRQGRAQQAGQPQRPRQRRLGADEIAAARDALGWRPPVRRCPPTSSPTGATLGARGSCHAAWEARLAASARKGGEFERRMAGDLPAGDEAARLYRLLASLPTRRSRPARPAKWRWKC
jgi:transketolase